MLEFNARHHMEKAIEVMRQSVAEPRQDGKVAPKVGAVLLDIGDDIPSHGRITQAYRGELRDGDHAEFTLLERKNRDRKLDNCVLFKTLEPCAPKARKPPKLGCAERIVLARIKEAWIGIEDPDPTVDRKGIKYLQEKGVKVRMFDRDLQEIIREENSEFIEQALERAAAIEDETREVSLSALEAPAENVQVRDLSQPALQEYRSRARIADKVTSDEFRRRLVRQGLLESDGTQFVPTGFGSLLFGKEPRTAMPQEGLLATIHYPDGTEEVQDFDGPQVLVPGEVLQWLEGKLPNVIDRSQAVRARTSGVFFSLIREGIVNALVHRDYDITGAKCQLVISKDKVEIRSPGLPVEPITLEQMQALDAPMLSRNPVLHYVFAKMGLAEERGLGLKSMRQRSQEAGLPLPRYSWEAPYLVLRLLPDVQATTTTTLPPPIQTELSESERAGWQWLSTRGQAKSSDYAEAMGIDARTARRHLNRFVGFGLVRKSGSARSTVYEPM
ncbi:MAG: hypothetical protein O3A00_00555 [Planctomycetota bacterium]|nr:hypothetical protein [Planctomycetota bacterium]